ncbi:NAD(P)/FAD-dependent oxidoreductase [Rurimicrobium arvi]|uniref:Kynurenine 3-monooxygenase n=1 Tax=Rurimicrobium arvi TaxID=2049916 RepID=A0ABP8MPI8_9BACT
MSRSVTILGAGLVGSLLAVILSKKGYKVTIYERRPDMRSARIAAGRSINLAVSVRGWNALEIAGIKEAIEPIAIPMFGRSLHMPDGSAAYQQYGKNNEAIYSVSRGELNKKLMTVAEEAGATIFFDHRCTHVNVHTNELTFQHEDKEVKVQADLLFGADGAFSALRSGYVTADRVDASQFYLAHGYKELTIPPAEDGGFRLAKEALHIWPRHNYMLIALPNTDGSFTCTLFFPFEGAEASFAALKSDADVQAFFLKNFPDAVELMPTLLEDFRNNPTASLITTRIFPWHMGDKSALIGDAAHAIVPFYGQGMNAGFEDCTVLLGLMDEYGDDWEKILGAYEQKRKCNGDAVGELAIMNFVEMRDKVADPVFLERKRLEKELGKMFPEQFISIYEMVSFSHTPYDTVMKCIKAQDALLERVMNVPNLKTIFETAAFGDQLKDWVAAYHTSVKDLDFGPAARK